MKDKEASEIIKKNKMNIINLWEDDVRASIQAAEKTYQAALVNTLPVFLDGMSKAFDPEHPLTLPTDDSNVALEHGGERARLTAYTPEHIVKEYQILRKIILQYLKKEGRLNEQITEYVTSCIEEACMHSCKGFFETVISLREHFMLTLSHDLRSPLSIAKVGVEFIQKEPGNVTRIKELSFKVAKALDRIDQMLQSLLDASKLKWGEKLNLHFAPADLSQILREVVNELTLVYGDRFKLDTPESINGVWDAEAIKRVFENLIVNGIKYGSEETPITISVKVLYSKALITIHNLGSYISIEDQKKLFDLFKQLHKHTNPRQGWGIGLLLVKGVMEGHGGAVTIDSSLENGTSFIVDLPLDGEKLSKADSEHPKNSD